MKDETEKYLQSESYEMKILENLETANKFEFCWNCATEKVLHCHECVNASHFTRKCTCGSAEHWATCSAPNGWSECG